MKRSISIGINLVTLIAGVVGFIQCVDLPGVNAALSWCCGVAVGSGGSFLYLNLKGD